MPIPQIGTPVGSLLVTVFLWFWTIKRGRTKFGQQEALLRQQNRSASVAFALCFLFQISAMVHDSLLMRVSLGSGCAFAFIYFVITSHRQGEGFWTKRRNQIFAGVLYTAVFVSLPFVIADLYFIPVIAGVAISHMCQRRFVQLFSSSLRDLEALQAKLLKQEAVIQNTRHLDTDPTLHGNAYHTVEKALESRA